MTGNRGDSNGHGADGGDPRRSPRSSQDQAKVKATLETILLDPEYGKALKAELLGLRSVRVGRLRIIYRITPAAIGPRRTVYEETVRLLRRETEEKMSRSAE